MALSGGLSNRHLSDIVNSLTSAPRRQDPPNTPKADHTDGRRAFGSVGKAVLSVLAEAERELTAHEIRLRVEILLQGSVSRYSIAYQLKTRMQGSSATVVQTNSRHYRLRS